MSFGGSNANGSRVEVEFYTHRSGVVGGGAEAFVDGVPGGFARGEANGYSA